MLFLRRRAALAEGFTMASFSSTRNAAQRTMVMTYHNDELWSHISRL
jgi:hypothetical protein